jgi:hypothetical protein
MRCDLVPAATFRVLYVFLALEHERRRILHFNVTEGPSAQWTAQQLNNAFPYDSAPKYVIRDRDKIYGAELRSSSACDESRAFACIEIARFRGHSSAQYRSLPR